MKKFITLLIILAPILYGKELVYIDFSETINSSNIIDGYNRWKDEILELSLNEKLRQLERLRYEGEIQKEELKFLYREAEYRILTEREQLKNDLVRGKIYYYYYKHHRKYYYYDFNYNIIYLKGF
ncbi:MAG: hypothetical protein ACRC92_14580 [Peptostreptococcaceae bacterium]